LDGGAIVARGPVAQVIDRYVGRAPAIVNG
jgi:hypothetical protein